MFAAATVAVAAVGTVLTDLGPWYKSLKMPGWKPPDWMFGPAWTLIYTMIAVAGIFAWKDASDPVSRRWLVFLMTLSLALNVLWSYLFFTVRRPDWALAEVMLLWLSIVLLILAVAGYSRRAAVSFSPYLVWVSFAGVLNAEVVRLNGFF